MGVRVEDGRVHFPVPHRGLRLAAAVVLALGGAARAVEVILRGHEPLGVAAGVAAVALGVIVAWRTRSGPWVDAEGWHAPGRGRNRRIPWDEVTKVRIVGAGGHASWGLETDPDRGPLHRWTRTPLGDVGAALDPIRQWAATHGTEVVDLTRRERDGAG